MFHFQQKKNIFQNQNCSNNKVVQYDKVNGLVQYQFGNIFNTNNRKTVEHERIPK